jgi:hypothetical protein
MIKGPAMPEKTPRLSTTKTSGKSVKDEHAAGRAKLAAQPSSTEALLHDKKH